MSDEVGELPYYKVQDYETAMVYFPFAGLNQFCSGYIHVSRLWDAANKSLCGLAKEYYFDGGGPAVIECNNLALVLFRL